MINLLLNRPMAQKNSKSKEYEIKLDYQQLIIYMKELRAFFQKEYETHFKLGN